MADRVSSADAVPLSPRVRAIIPAHNRRETTLACLRHLRDIGALAWLAAIVVDDGSSDGTDAAVRAEFPDATVVRGDGTLWWTGAITLGMQHALREEACDALFWLNDDCRPACGSLELLLSDARAEPCITLAQVTGPGGIRHGGLMRRWHGLELAACAPEEIRAVDTMNGDCVCLPAVVAEQIGPPEAANFPQAWGDTDFGLRCRRAGVAIKVIGAAGCAEADPAHADDLSWLRGDRSVPEIARSFASPKNYFFPPAWWRFNLRHWGAWGVLLFAVPYLRFVVIAALRALLPTATRRRWFPHRAAPTEPAATSR